MAAYVKYYQFVQDLVSMVHDLFGTTPWSDCDALKVMLSNTAGDVAQTLATRSQVTEIANGNGYTTGGLPTGANGLNSGARTDGTFTLTGTNQTWTGGPSDMGAFRYVILYNDTPSSPADPLIASWDYGSALTLHNGDTFTVKFNNGASSGTIFTLA